MGSNLHDRGTDRLLADVAAAIDLDLTTSLRRRVIELAQSKSTQALASAATDPKWAHVLNEEAAKLWALARNMAAFVAWWETLSETIGENTIFHPRYGNSLFGFERTIGYHLDGETPTEVAHRIHWELAECRPLKRA